MRARPVMTAVLAILLASVASPVVGQAPDAPGDRDRSRLEERIRARMGEIIRERLGLSEAEAEQLSSIAREFEGRRRALGREERAARRQAEELLSSGTPPDDQAAAALLERFVALRIQEAELVREEQVRLQEVLSAGQVLQLYELRAEIGRRIRAIRSRGDDRPGRGGRPGGGGSSER